jgi:hypothetical protein
MASSFECSNQQQPAVIVVVQSHPFRSLLIVDLHFAGADPFVRTEDARKQMFHGEKQDKVNQTRVGTSAEFSNVRNVHKEWNLL